MVYVGIDLHKRDLVMAFDDGHGPVGRPRRYGCRDTEVIVTTARAHGPFEAVIEASASYRWLYELLSPYGTVHLAHPLGLRAIGAGRAKTDKLDAARLAELLRGGLIPEAYIPPDRYQALRKLTRMQARLGQDATDVKCRLDAVLSARNVASPYRNRFGPRGRRWLRRQDLGAAGNWQRDELVRRLEYFETERARLDEALSEQADAFGEVEALTALYGIGTYSALLIIAELGEVSRFSDARQVGAYAGLTARVTQSGAHSYHGHITRQGSPWLRWVLVQAAMKLVRKDRKLAAMYQRIRKRSSRHIARVAVARKLAGICWIRLKRWHREHAVD